MRYYIIAGEASGDLHGGNVVKSIFYQDPEAIVRAWGGDYMQEEGAELIKHYKDLAFMGFVEVIAHLPEILNNLKFCKSDILKFKPDVLILIDYPGFNLRIAKWAKNNNIKVCYYISPQIWAWKENRIKTIKQSVDKLLVILPFEEKFYHKHGLKATFVGHPLTERIEKDFIKGISPLSSKPIIALLPGSRTQEIKNHLSIMVNMVDKFPDYQFIIAQAPSQDIDIYQRIIKDKPIKIVKNKTYELLKQSKAALVTSGTATLETALFGVPQIVCYKGNIISYWLAKTLIKVKYISLVNLILDKPAVKELIQGNLTEDKLLEELETVLYNKEQIDHIQSDYTKLWELLGNKKTSDLVAKAAFRLASKTP